MPPSSGPASTGTTTSAPRASSLSSRLVTATTVETPACLVIASTVSSEPPDAETTNASVSPAGGCGVPVDASSTCASWPRARSSAAAVCDAYADDPIPISSTRRPSTAGRPPDP